MVQTIKIFNPKEKPFGWLSNNYRHLMFIDKNRYFTVTNYIYSNMLSTPQYRTILKNSPVDKVHENYLKLLHDEEVTTTRQAIDIALDAKFESNEVLMNTLISTGNSDIIYNSNNKVLGINSQGEGLNLYGEALKQVRQRIKSNYLKKEQEKTAEEYDNSLYETYIAYKELVKAIKSGDDLEKYINKTAPEVIDMMGKQEIMSKAPSKEFVIEQLHLRKNIPRIPRNVRFEQLREGKTDLDIYLDSLKGGKSAANTTDMTGQKVDWDKRAKEEDLDQLAKFYQEHEDTERTPRKSYKRPRMTLAPPPEFIIDPKTPTSLIDKEVYEIVNSPSSLVYIVRKKYLPDLRRHQQDKQEEAIATAYAEYELAKNFPDIRLEDYNKAIQQQFRKISYENKLMIGNNILVLYKDDKLPEKLSKSIDKLLNEIVVPTEEEVAVAEQYTIVHKDDEAKLVHLYKKTDGQPVVIFAYPNDNMKPEYNVLSPVHDSMFRINDRLFPSVSHYIIFNLFQNLLNNTTESYSKLLGINAVVGSANKDNFVSPETAMARLNDTATIVKMDKLKKYSQIGLNNKFLDRILQDVLLLTEDSELIWDDRNDVFLGVGPQGIHGDNEVGKYLMVLREHFREERKTEQIEQLSTDDITSIIEKDEFFRAWIDMRVTDICKVIITMKTYLFRKDGKENIEITSEFVDSVMDDIYQPCSHIFSLSDQVTASVPHYFKVMILNKPGFSKVSEDVIEIIWNRIAVMVYFMIEFSKDKGIQNIRAIIVKLEQLVSKGNKCVRILDNELDNCIVSALINLITGLSEFNKKFSSNNIVSKIDVETAASIIVNRDISSEIQDMIPNIMIEETDDIKLIDDPQIFETIDDDDDDDEDKEITDYEDDFEELSDDSGGGYTDDKGLLSLKELRRTTAPQSGNIRVNKVIIGSIDPTRQQKNAELINILSSIEGINHVEDIENIMLSAIETIKSFRMSSMIKNNRINFFATQR